MIGNSIAGRVAAFINNAERDPSLWQFERVVYKAALTDQGADVIRIIDAATRDAQIMQRGVRMGRVAA
jgi:hypothetical protein